MARARTPLWLRVGMTLSLAIALSSEMAAMDIWYPDVANLSIVRECVLPSRYTPITPDKVEIIAGALGIEPGELHKFLDKEITFYFLLGVSLLMLNNALLFTYYYRKVTGVFPKPPLPLWQKLLFGIERYSLFVFTPAAILSFVLILPTLSYEGLYAEFKKFSHEMLKMGIIDTPLAPSLCINFSKLVLFFVIALLVLMSMEYILYLPYKRKGYSFLEYFTYHPHLWFIPTSRSEKKASE